MCSGSRCRRSIPRSAASKIRAFSPSGLGIKFLQIPIKDSFEAVRAQFTDIFAGLPAETKRRENMQPRLRRPHADSDLEQTRPPPPFHGQQSERACRRAIARSTATCAGGPGGHHRCPQDAGQYILPPSGINRDKRNHSAPTTVRGHRASTRRPKPDRSGQPAALRAARRRSCKSSCDEGSRPQEIITARGFPRLKENGAWVIAGST